MGFRLLLVDDSNIVRKVLVRTLAMTDLDVSEIAEASNGKEALERLQSGWFDLVFLDINMPIMNGVEFMERVRADESLKETPVVIVSTEGSAERISRLNDLGVKAYLRKPVTPEDLASTVRDILLGGA